MCADCAGAAGTAACAGAAGAAACACRNCCCCTCSCDCFFANKKFLGPSSLPKKSFSFSLLLNSSTKAASKAGSLYSSFFIYTLYKYFYL